jgi:MFS family permease
MTTQAQRPRKARIPLRETALLVGALGSIYAVSQFLRNSIGVIAPDLADELRLSAGQIGLLSSLFFFVFAGVQIPLGIALDRFGPRRCMLACSALTVAGVLMFAAAASPGWLIGARVLMGLGCSCYLMAPLALYARRYPPERFATLVGLQIGLGTLGTLLATAPFAFAVAAAGWRASFAAVALVVALIASLIALVVDDDAGTVTAPSAPRETLRESLAGALAVMRGPSFWPVFAMQLAAYSSFVLVAGLWGGPYLTHVYGFGLTERGNMLFVAVATQIVFSFLWGPADRVFGSYKVPVLIGGLGTAATLVLAALVGTFSPLVLLLWFVAIGAFPACMPVLIAHGKALFPPQRVGRALVLFNMASMGGVFLTQTITGVLIDLFPRAGDGYALNAYRCIFAVQAVAILLGCIAYSFSRDPRSKS